MRLFLREMNERDMNTVLQPTQTHRERSPSLQQWHNFPGPKSTLPSSLQGRTHHTLQWSVKNGQNPRALFVCHPSQAQPLSLIMWASSMINFPSLYFWLDSKACSWKCKKNFWNKYPSLTLQHCIHVVVHILHVQNNEITVDNW